MARNKSKGPGGPGINTVEKAKDFKGTLKKIIKCLMEYKVAVILVFIFAIGSTIFAIVGPKILGNATTELFAGVMNKFTNNGGINFEKIGQILLTVLILYVVSTIFSFVQGYIMAIVSQKITYKLRNKISEKINRLPMNFFDKKSNGEVLSIITNDVDTLSMGLNQSITQMITCICTVIGILVMMFSISITMTIISILILPISGFIVKKIVGKSQKYFIRQQEYLGHVNGQVEEMYSGHTIVKAFCGEEKAIEEFNKANEQLYKSAWKSQFLSRINAPSNEFHK